MGAPLAYVRSDWNNLEKEPFDPVASVLKDLFQLYEGFLQARNDDVRNQECFGLRSQSLIA